MKSSESTKIRRFADLVSTGTALLLLHHNIKENVVKYYYTNKLINTRPSSS